MGVTADLCDKIVATTFDSLTPEAVTKARRLVLDGIAVAVAGSREDAIGILADHYKALGGTPDAVVLGLGFRTSATAAAVLNGASMHVLDFEPMWNPANHALSTTLPAILSLAESRKLAGRDIVTALVKGIEMAGWIRAASHHGAIRFHPPGMVGPMGASVAAGHVLGLNAGQQAHALGIAASSLIPNMDAGPAIVNLPYFVLVFISGTYFPISGGLAKVAAWLPLRPFIVAMFKAFDPRTTGSAWSPHQLGSLLIWGVVGTVFAARHFRWTPRRG